MVHVNGNILSAKLFGQKSGNSIPDPWKQWLELRAGCLAGVFYISIKIFYCVIIKLRLDFRLLPYRIFSWVKDLIEFTSRDTPAGSMVH